MPRFKIAVATLAFFAALTFIPARAAQSPVEALKNWNTTEQDREKWRQILLSTPSKGVENARELFGAENWPARLDALYLAQALSLPILSELIEKGLSDPVWAVRARAAQAATFSDAAQREKIRPLLRAACKDKIHKVRLQAYTTLTNWKIDPELLAEAIEDPSAEIVTWSASELVKAAGQAGITDELKARLIEKTIASWSTSGWPPLDANSYNSFFALGPLVNDELHSALSQEPVQVRRQVLENLLNMTGGQSTLGLFQRFMDDPDLSVGQLAVRVVCDYSTAASCPELLKMLSNTNDHFQKSMLLQAVTRHNYKPAAPLLLKMVQNDQQFKHMAMNSLLQIGDKSMLPQILEIYKKEPQPYLRAQMLPLIAKWMEKGAGDFLKQSFLDGDQSCRSGAIRGAAVLPEAEKKMFLLWVLKEDPNEYTRAEAVSNLASIRTDDVVDAISAVIKDDGGPHLVINATRALAMMSTEKSIKAFADAYEQAEEGIRPQILQSLQSVQYREAITALKRLTAAQDEELRKMAFIVLVSRFQDSVDEKTLLQMLENDPTEDMLYYGGSIITQRSISSPEVLPIIEKMFESQQQHVKMMGINCLNQIKHPKAVQMLTKLMEDEDESIKQTAIQHLIMRFHQPEVKDEAIVKALIEVMESAEEASAINIVATAASTRNKAFLPLLFKALTLHPAAASAALEVICENPTKEVLAELMAVAEKTESNELKLAIISRIPENQPESLEFLKKQLTVEDNDIRLAAINELSAYHDQSLVPVYVEIYKTSKPADIKLAALNGLLRHKDRRSYEVIADAINQLENNEAISDLDLSCLDMVDPKISAAVVERMCKDLNMDSSVVTVAAAPRLSVTTELLLKAAKTAKPSILSNICNALGENRDRRAEPFLLDTLKNTADHSVRSAAINALRRIDAKKHTGVFLEIMKASDGLLMLNAATAATEGGAGDAVKKYALEQIKDAPQGPARASWVQALPENALDTTALAELLEDPSEEMAIAVVAKLNPEDPSALELLQQYIETAPENESLFGRVMKVKDVAFLTELFNAVDSGDFRRVNLKRAALQALVQNNSPNAGELAAGCLSDREMIQTALLVYQAIPLSPAEAEHLLLILNKIPEVDQQMLQTVHDSGRGMAEAAVTALGNAKYEPAFDKIVELSSSGYPEMREAAVISLSKYGVENAYKMIEQVFANDNCDKVRAAAALALGKTGQKKYTPSLAKAIAVAGNPLVQSACAEGLGMLGGDDAVKAILPALKDESGMVREAAVKAILKIGIGKELLKGMEADNDVDVANAAKENK